MGGGTGDLGVHLREEASWGMAETLALWLKREKAQSGRRAGGFWEVERWAELGKSLLSGAEPWSSGLTPFPKVPRTHCCAVSGTE